jgi:hypothetical protein
MLFMCPAWSGDRSRGEPIVEQLRRVGTPVSADLGPMPYADALSLLDASAVDGQHYFLRTRWLAELTDRCRCSWRERGNLTLGRRPIAFLHTIAAAARRHARRE